MAREIATHRLTWRSIEIEVRYEAEWLSVPSTGFRTAHLELCSIRPEREPLPVTETGYRSRFLPREDVEAEGGPEAYVLAWLDYAAASPEWREQEATRQQLTLF